ncbi:MAG: histidine phosphatase family protein [Peptoniphilaceae bacterium]
MVKIYFTRHGETNWNNTNIIQGHMDSDLTENGVEMALQLREEVKDIKFDKIYSSDLGRAYKTAELIVPGQEIIKTKLLREIDMGDWSGMYFPDIEEKYPELHNTYFNNPDKYYRDDGESLYDLNKRVKKFFEKNIYKTEDETILIVSHGVTIISIFNLMENNPIENFWKNRGIKNAAFNIAEYDGGKFKIIKKASKTKLFNI